MRQEQAPASAWGAGSVSVSVSVPVPVPVSVLLLVLSHSLSATLTPATVTPWDTDLVLLVLLLSQDTGVWGFEHACAHLAPDCPAYAGQLGAIGEKLPGVQNTDLAMNCCHCVNCTLVLLLNTYHSPLACLLWQVRACVCAVCAQARSVWYICALLTQRRVRL